MHSISIFVVFALAFSYTLAYGVETDAEWELWKKTYNKKYSDSGERIRYEIYLFSSILNIIVVVSSGKEVCEP
jgi:hypothetical protein